MVNFPTIDSQYSNLEEHVMLILSITSNWIIVKTVDFIFV